MTLRISKHAMSLSFCTVQYVERTFHFKMHWTASRIQFAVSQLLRRISITSVPFKNTIMPWHYDFNSDKCYTVFKKHNDKPQMRRAFLTHIVRILFRTKAVHVWALLQMILRQLHCQIISENRHLYAIYKKYCILYMKYIFQNSLRNSTAHDKVHRNKFVSLNSGSQLQNSDIVQEPVYVIFVHSCNNILHQTQLLWILKLKRMAQDAFSQDVI